MRVLLTNDDGFDADGIKLLKNIVSGIASEIWMAAPNRDRSGSGRSVTLRSPIKVNQLAEREFSIDGTPSECVLIALNTLMKDRAPDLILSGINHGSNVGADASCSGTAGAALEGALLKIPSIALSQRYSEKNLPINWEVAKMFALPIIKYLTSCEWPVDVAMNVNFPDINPSDIQGIKLIKQGKHTNPNDLECQTSETGDMFCFIMGNRPAVGDGSVAAICDGFIAITPIKADLTDYFLLDSPLNAGFTSVFDEAKMKQ